MLVKLLWSIIRFGKFINIHKTLFPFKYYKFISMSTPVIPDYDISCAPTSAAARRVCVRMVFMVVSLGRNPFDPPLPKGETGYG